MCERFYDYFHSILLELVGFARHVPDLFHLVASPLGLSLGPTQPIFYLGGSVILVRGPDQLFAAFGFLAVGKIVPRKEFFGPGPVIAGILQLSLVGCGRPSRPRGHGREGGCPGRGRNVVVAVFLFGAFFLILRAGKGIRPGKVVVRLAVVSGLLELSHQSKLFHRRERLLGRGFRGGGWSAFARGSGFYHLPLVGIADVTRFCGGRGRGIFVVTVENIGSQRHLWYGRSFFGRFWFLLWRARQSFGKWGFGSFG